MTTIRLTEEEFALATRTDAPPKLSRVPPGHWRCKWRFKDGFIAGADPGPGVIVIDETTWISPPRFVSRELADEDAAKWLRIDPRFHYAVYVEAVFFPGERP